MGTRYLSIIQEAIDIHHIYKRPFHRATDSVALSGWREKSLKGNRIATNSQLEHLCPGLHAGGVEDEARYSLLQGHMLLMLEPGIGQKRQRDRHIFRHIRWRECRQRVHTCRVPPRWE